MVSPVIRGSFVVSIEDLIEDFVQPINGHPIGGEDSPIEVEDHRADPPWYDSGEGSPPDSRSNDAGLKEAGDVV